MTKLISWTYIQDFHELDDACENVIAMQWRLNDEDHPRHGIILSHLVFLNYSTDLYKWLGRNCRGHYTTGTRIAWAKRTGRAMEFIFELERDAVLAKLFHGGHW